MLPRWAFWLLTGVTTLVAAVLGAADAALRTQSGRTVVVRMALNAANKALDGRLTVGSFEGSLRRGLEAHDVRVEGLDGVEMARIPSLTVQYRLRDILRGKIVLGQLKVTRPVVTLIQAPGGRLNAEDIMGLGKPGPRPPGRRPLIAFSDVEIVDGSLRIRTLVNATDHVAEREMGPHGNMRVRRITGINAKLPYFRLMSPVEDERTIRIDITDLSARVSDPDLDIRGAEGIAEIVGDTAKLDLSRVALPHSRAAMTGMITWHDRALQYNLAIDGKSVSVDDVRGLAPGLPKGLLASGSFTVRTVGPVFEFQSARITVRGARDGGTFTGQLGMSLGPGEKWAAKNTDVTLDNFDLEYVRPILDTMPIAGRLSGALKADGPRERLAIEVDWSFRDSLVAGWPESQVKARGVVSMGIPGGFAFRGLAVEQARIDLGTVRRLIPAVVLRGVMLASGSLNGPWLEPEFSGILSHRDAPLPVSVARGVVRLDARGDTLGVWANVVWDSLRFRGFKTSYPDLPLAGTFGGEFRVSGYADSLNLEGDLTGPAGRLVGGGIVTLVSPRLAVRALDLSLRDVSLDGLHPALPPSRVFARLTGDLAVDTLVAPAARIIITADSSLVAGSRLDSLRGAIVFVDSLLRFENVGAWAPGVQLTAQGGLGWGGSRPDSLTFTADADLLRETEPFVRWLLKLEADTAEGGPSGAAHVQGTVKGRTGAIRLAGIMTVPQLRWSGLEAAGARVAAEVGDSGGGHLSIHWVSDSAKYRGFSATALNIGFSGRRDSLGWFAAGSLGNSARLDGVGRAHRDSLATALLIDSLRLSLPEHVWRTDTGAIVTVTDSALWFSRMTLNSLDGGARLAIEGTLPLSGSGKLHLTAEQVGVKDLLAVLQRDVAAGGTVSGNFDLSGTAAKPVMQGALSVVNGLYGGFRVPQAEGSFTYEARRLKGILALRRLGEHLLDLELDLPIDLALWDVANRRVDGPLSIRGVADSVDLAFLSALTPNIRQAGGRFDADVGITGTWSRPVLAGLFSVAHAAMSLPSVGVRYEGLNASFGLAGDTIRVDSMSLESSSLATKGTRGTASVAGYLRLEQLSDPVVALRLTGRDFHLLDVRNFLAAAITGSLDLSGPLVGATLTGRGTMTSGVLYFADLVTKQVVNLQDTLLREVVQDTSLIRRQGLGPAFHNVFWDSLRIVNLSVDMGSEVWLRSNEANIQLLGEVNLNKRAATYRLDGSLTAPRGRYSLLVPPFLSRDFTVTQGEVTYFGTPDLNADLDIDAQYVVRRRGEEDVTVVVHIGGTLYVPQLMFSTTPRSNYSDAEIISLLMIGTTRPEQLGEWGSQAVIERLSGVLAGLGESTLGSVMPGLQYVTIKPGEFQSGSPNGTQIAMGFQVGPSLFVNLSPRVCNSGNTEFLSPDNFGASLEFRLNRQWRIAASMDPAGTCRATGARTSNAGRQMGLDLFWEKRF